MARVLIAGCGYLGLELGRRLLAQGHSVAGLRRRIGNLPDGFPNGFTAVEADLSQPSTLAVLRDPFDFVFYTAAADRGDDRSYRQAYVAGPRNLLQRLDELEHPPQRVFFASSTRVYPQSSGESVNELSPTRGDDFRSRRLLEGERVLQNASPPCTIVRFGGIYGPGRMSLARGVAEGRFCLDAGKSRYTNRIHRDDAASLLHHLMGLEGPQLHYLGVDSDPATRNEVLRWLADKLAVPLPISPSTPDPTAKGTATKSAKHSANGKRCSNGRILATGYSFLYPSFRDGYSTLLDSSPLHSLRRPLGSPPTASR